MTIPADIVGRTESDAREALRRLGITGEVVTALTHSPPTVPPAGVVISTAPAPPGGAIAVDSKVELQVSTGKVLMPPQLIALPLAEAEAALKANGLTMAVVEQENSQVAAGTVTAQSDAFNTEVAQARW